MTTFVRPKMVSIDIDDGSYRATCIRVESKEKAWKDDPPKPGVAFIYKVVNRQGKEIELSRHLTLATGKRANLRKDMVGIHGQKAWDESLKSDEGFNALINSTVNKTVIMTISTHTTSDGFDNKNIDQVLALPSGGSKGAAQTATIDDDDIPF